MLRLGLGKADVDALKQEAEKNTSLIVSQERTGHQSESQEQEAGYF